VRWPQGECACLHTGCSTWHSNGGGSAALHLWHASAPAQHICPGPAACISYFRILRAICAPHLAEVLGVTSGAQRAETDVTLRTFMSDRRSGLWPMVRSSRALSTWGRSIHSPVLQHAALDRRQRAQAIPDYERS